MLSSRVLVDVSPGEDCIDKYFIRLESEQDSQTTNANLSFGSSVNEMVGGFNGVLLSVKQGFDNAPSGVGVQAPKIACRLLAELQRTNGTT